MGVEGEKQMTQPKTLIMADGREVEIDDTPYYIGKDNTLYVYVPTPCGARYMPMGKVKEETK